MQHLAHMMLVQVMRLYMADGLPVGVSWLFVLSDRQLGAALTVMHGEPGRRRTVQALARCAGMSHSTFAAKFKETVARHR